MKYLKFLLTLTQCKKLFQKFAILSQKIRGARTTHKCSFDDQKKKYRRMNMKFFNLPCAVRRSEECKVHMTDMVLTVSSNDWRRQMLKRIKG